MDNNGPKFFGLTLSQIAIVAPTFASTCAFGYVVGYFYAFDIAWFPFFGLSDHVVFALRALPIALTALVCFAMALLFRIYSRRVTLAPWMALLVILVAFGSDFFRSLLRANHLGPAFSLFFLSIWIIIFPYYEYRRRNSDNIQYIDLSYWAITLASACVFAGYLSGKPWRCEKKIAFSDVHNMYINEAIDGVQPPGNFGHVIFSGSRGALIYSTMDHGLRLIPWEKINRVGGCSEDCGKEFKPQASEQDSTSTEQPGQTTKDQQKSTSKQSKQRVWPVVTLLPPSLNFCPLIGSLFEHTDDWIWFSMRSRP